MKVKVVEVVGYDSMCDCCDADNTLYVRGDESEWSEVSQEDYQSLTQWAIQHNRHGDHKIVVIKEVPQNQVAAKIEQYLDKAKAAMIKAKEEEERRLKKEEQQKLARLKGQEAKKKKLEEQEMKTFERLREKYGSQLG